MFENYYIDRTKERMVKETEYVATLAEEQGFNNVLKNPYVFEKLEEKYQLLSYFWMKKESSI